MSIHKKSIVVLTVVLTMCYAAGAQTPGINFIQQDTLSLVESKKGYYEIDLKSAPFTILFQGKELHVCAGMDEELFNFTKPDTDINADFNSYFFIFKYLAGSEDTDYLSIEKDTGNSLNESHGAKPAGKGLYKFTVKALRKDGTEKLVSEFEELFLALWLDSNKDQYIDKAELLWVKAKLH